VSNNSLPTNAIEHLPSQNDGWYIRLVKVFPHHTDYSGVVWHGTYLTWMEEARVETLSLIGIEYADLVSSGYELPVVEMSIRYHKSVRMGMTVAVKTKMMATEGVKINWDYLITSPDGDELYVTAKVTLVAVDREKGKIMRRLPASVQDFLNRLAIMENQ